MTSITVKRIRLRGIKVAHIAAFNILRRTKPQLMKKISIEHKKQKPSDLYVDSTQQVSTRKAIQNKPQINLTKREKFVAPEALGPSRLND